MKIFTIGHSNHPIERFIKLLQERGIALLVDARSTPYSRFHPHFKGKNLALVLPQNGISYIFSGEALGGRPKDLSCYRIGTGGAQEIDYSLVMQRDWFCQGIDRLIEQARERVTAVLCAEADPSRCHRHHLIARYLANIYPENEVLHILKDGSLVNAKSVGMESSHT